VLLSSSAVVDGFMLKAILLRIAQEALLGGTPPASSVGAGAATQLPPSPPSSQLWVRAATVAIAALGQILDPTFNAAERILKGLALLFECNFMNNQHPFAL
jgi:hypothetical protein